MSSTGTPDWRIRQIKEHITIARNERRRVSTGFLKFHQLYSQRTLATPNHMHEVYEYNMNFPNVETLVAAGTSQVPQIFVSPRKREVQLNAVVAEAVLEYWFERMRIAKEWRLADRDAKITGVGWLKTTWSPGSRRSDRQPQIDKEMFTNGQVRRDTLAQVLGFDKLPSDEDLVKYLMKKAEQATIGEPTVTRISPNDMLFDPFCARHEQARWVGNEYWRPLRAIWRDKNMRKGVSKDVKAGTPFGDIRVDAPYSDLLAQSDAMERVRLTEVWDREERRLIILAPDVEVPIYDESWPYTIGDPYTPISCFDVPDTPWARGAIEVVLDEVLAMNANRQRIRSLRDSMRIKHFVSTQLQGNEDVLRVLKSKVDGDSAFVDIPAGANMGEYIYTLSPPDMNPDLYREDGQIRQDAEDILGITSLIRGQQLDTSHHSALEVTTAASFGAARLVTMVDNTHQALLDVARKMIGLAGEFMSSQDVVKIRGAWDVVKDKEELAAQLQANGAFGHGADMMYPFNGHDIDGEFDFSLEVGSSMPEDGQTRAARALQMAQILLPIPEVNKKPVIDLLLRETFHIKDTTEFFVGPGQPLQSGQNAGQGSTGGVAVQQPGGNVAPGAQQLDNGS